MALLSLTYRRAAFALALVFAAGPALAQETGDANRGRAYAERTCVGCHGILITDTASPIAAAPTFSAIANTRGIGATALVVWFRTPHPSMPNLIIQGDDMDNVIAYIFSLKQAK